MSGVAQFVDSLDSIGSRTDADMSERDVESSFLENGLYDALGYEGTEADIRNEFTFPTTAARTTLDTNEAAAASSGSESPDFDAGRESHGRALHERYVYSSSSAGF